MARRSKYTFIDPDQLSSGAMTCGNEKKLTVVLDQALVVKRWVGIGWVTERVAEASDLNLYPIVKRPKGFLPQA